MQIAIVANGQFLHTKPAGQMVRDSQGVMRPRVVDKAEGWYEFIPARDESGAVAYQAATAETPEVLAVPKTRKAQGTTFTVDDVAGMVTESFLYVDLTADEIKAANNTPLLAQIAALELQQLMPRATREYMRATYLAAAVAQGVSEAQLRQKPTEEVPNPLYSIAYDKLATFDDTLTALRSELQ